MQQEIWFQKYRILGLLGVGGNSEVYLAEHIKLNSYRAIKFISKTHPLYDLQCKEALILKNLKHSCIPIIYDIEEDADGSYIVEQYLEGDTLKSYVLAKGSCSDDTIIRFGIQLCDLIEYLHSTKRPILYVDLKPDNIILSGITLKLIDFGSALYQDELTKGQSYMGTKGYAAPELYGNKIIDQRCDVYGVGMLMYYMATGINISENTRRFIHIDNAGNCSKELKKVINNCLKYNPSQRFASISRLKKQLLTIERKNQYRPKTSQPVKIAIAGSQTRIGVTHLSLRLCKYLSSQRQKYLYMENNNSGCVGLIKCCYEEVNLKDEVFLIDGIPMLSQKHYVRQSLEDYQFILQDMGCLTKDNLEEFLSADIKLLILGAKEWELKKSEQIINLTAEYEDIAYLFNYIDGRQFQEVMMSMEGRKCFRIPYEPNPFAKMKYKSEGEFYEDLISVSTR